MANKIFVIYVSDLNLWLKHSIVGTYADDTQSSVSDKLLQTVRTKLEQDALQVLKFIAADNSLLRYLYNCSKLVQGFRVTCLFNGQYNTKGYGTITDVIFNAYLNANS